MPTLNWLTRDEDLKSSANAPYRLLAEDEKLSYGDPDSENLIVQGDNLEALKALLPFYAGQVKCIYIDPPYNTGSAFEHYDDNMEHTTWLSIMYPRLELLKQFLREDGLFFCSIDNKEHQYLHILCDEIFGRNNFLSNIVWKKVTSAKTQSNFIGNVVEYVLVYSKSKNYKYFPLFLTSDETNDNKNYPYVEEETGRCYGSFDFTQKGQGEAKIFWGELLKPPKGKHWIWTQEKIDEGIKNNIIIKTKSGIPRLKRYLDNKKGNYLSDLWNDADVVPISANSKEAMNFFGQKPESLIKRIIQISTREGDLVLDSFLGSGTTAAVAHKMGRRYIGIEMGDHAKTHCVIRLQKVIDGEQGGISKDVNWNGGGGFRFFTLGEAIFDNERRIKSDISFENLAAHIYFSETKTPMKKPKKKSVFLGIHNGTAYALLYNGILGDKSINGGNVLTHKTLNRIKNDMESVEKKNKSELEYNQMVIYGEATRLAHVSLENNNIIFKQTPYDIKVW